MQRRKLLLGLGFAIALAVGLLAGRQLSPMGNTDAFTAPDATNEYTLEDLYTRLMEGNMDNVQMDVFDEPTVARGTGTMHTIQDLMAIAPGFTDHGDGTVTDLHTGLMWKKAGDIGPCSRGAAEDICRNLVYASYDDWRLSKATEIATLMDPRETSLLRNGHPFTAPQERYWTADDRWTINGVEHGLSIHFVDSASGSAGDAQGLPTSNLEHAWPVRGP